MADKVKRTSTKYKCIYKNEKTGLFDIKYNYTIHDPVANKPKYKSKWIYNISTIKEAKQELAKLEHSGVVQDDKEITLQGAYELWLIRAKSQDFSPVSINNTQDHLKMISQFMSLDVKLKDLNATAYEKLCGDLRAHGYSEESLRSLNATFRKLINLAYKKRLIKENFLDYADNLKIKDKQEDNKLISYDDYLLIDQYFKNNSFVRLGVDQYKKYRLLFSLLYYSGIRIGEALALTYDDLEEFNYYSKREQESMPPVIVPSSSLTSSDHLRGWRLKVSKAYVSDIKLTKDPKNFKHRSIPLPPAPVRLFMRYKQEHLLNGGDPSDRIFNITHGACLTSLKHACNKCGINAYCCHDFRHTYISLLISKNVPITVISKVSGDEINTIWKNYAHMFESDEVLVLNALQEL